VNNLCEVWCVLTPYRLGLSLLDLLPAQKESYVTILAVLHQNKRDNLFTEEKNYGNGY
jgi:hypothetical protein